LNLCIINLVIIQKANVFTASITTSLQKRGIDLVNVNEQIQLVIIELFKIFVKMYQAFIMIAINKLLD